MTGEGGLNGDLGRLLIPDFADHDHVGILTKQGAEGRGESHADLLMRLDLRDAVYVVFDRVLHGGDVELAEVHLLQ